LPGDLLSVAVPFVAIDALAFGLAWLILRWSPFYRGLIDEGTAGRAQMVDGLRGWLALGVFFTHVAAMYAIYVIGSWDTRRVGAQFFTMTGEMGVSLFFMITGFLFWGRVLREQPLDTEAFFVSRVRRIVPMYLASVALTLLVIAALSGFTLRVTPVELLRELRAWLSFGYIHGGDVNGVRDAHRINAVYWTLAYEWTFYLALPLLAVLARRATPYAVFAIAFVFCLQAPVTLNFIAGAVAAILVRRGVLGDRLAGWALSPVPIVALVSVLWFPTAFGLPQVLLMFIFFIFIVGGNSLFGLLASRPARLLGTISYSIYLVHCVVLYVVVLLANGFAPIATLALPEYWLVAALAALLAVLLSALTYRLVEYPYHAARPASATGPGDSVVHWVRPRVIRDRHAQRAP
jgi:peptidoglycan/LPS O-acetylase OafA/YrhL